MARFISRPTYIRRKLVLRIMTIGPKKMVWDSWENGHG